MIYKNSSTVGRRLPELLISLFYKRNYKERTAASAVLGTKLFSLLRPTVLSYSPRSPCRILDELHFLGTTRSFGPSSPMSRGEETWWRAWLVKTTSLPELA
jgi:hypothetical protein